MEDSAYYIESKIEEHHWWYVIRRYLFSKHIKNFKLDPHDNILDIGSSSGTNLRMLKDLGFKNYVGIDVSQNSREICLKKNLGEILIADICDNKFSNEQFQLIIAGDVIEHIQDDNKALSEIRRIVAKNGKVIISVPCFNILWSHHDETSKHFRRYTLSEIRGKIEKQNFIIDDCYYFNFILFAPILFYRKLSKIFNLKNKNDININNKIINQIFKIIFRLDVNIAKHLKPKFGVSCLLICRPKND